MRFRVKGGNTRGAVRTYSNLCKRWFASKAEAAYGEILYVQQRAGVISDLTYQPKYQLTHGVSYTADFRYVQYGRSVVVDVKGYLEPHTRVKLWCLYEHHGVHVRIVRAVYRGGVIRGWEESLVDSRTAVFDDDNPERREKEPCVSSPKKRTSRPTKSLT
jgi:predicted kinase